MNFETIIRTPDYVMTETENKWLVLNKSSENFITDDISVSFEIENDCMCVNVLAETSRLKHVKLRWNMSIPEKVMFLGDALERGYGDLQ